MMAAPLFNRELSFAYGAVDVLSPLVRRVIAQNPSPFTFHGTGTYLIGRGEVAVIDPGPRDESHLQAILAATAGERITHCLITHTHHDHSPLSARLKAVTGVRTYGFGPHGSGQAESDAAVEEGGDTDFVPDVVLRDGDIVTGPGWSLSAFHTPGHTSNHVCFALEAERALFSGDHVMGWSTTVVAPPDGDMRAYRTSLQRLATREDQVVYPTHGAPIGGPHDALKREPAAFMRALLAHRAARDEQILAAVGDGVARIQDMVARIYVGVDSRLHPAAALSVHAHLIALVAEGRVTCDGPPRLSSSYRLS